MKSISVNHLLIEGSPIFPFLYRRHAASPGADDLNKKTCLMLTDERRLVGGRPVTGPLVQLRMNVAQEEEGLVAGALLAAAAAEQVAWPAHGADELQLVVDGVEGRQAINFFRWRRSGRISG